MVMIDIFIFILHGHHAGELCVEIVRRRAQWRSGRDSTPVVVGNVLPDQTNKQTKF